ncbi:MAG: 23S rRNA pseudouridine2457 synthase [Arenicella sp.]|jgi:23S rRNA pseudouridine2457 synthase
MDKVFSYYIIFKPYGVLSQFSQTHLQHKTLADLEFSFAKDIYPVGRLDKDSEGLLILTNDSKLNHQLLNPSFAHSRAYAVQVDGQMTDQGIAMLENGIDIKLSKTVYHTLPAKARLLPDGLGLPERDPPVRFRKMIPTTWIEVTLTEGKNRQVRKMCAKTGFPVLRLVRTRIENLTLQDMKSGDVKQVEGKKMMQLLGV